MKINKLFLTVLSVLPAFAIAQTSGFNFYGKAGIDLTSRFESWRLTETTDNAPTPTKSRKNTFSPSIFLETTYNIFPQTELGFGVGYIKRAGFKSYSTWPNDGQGTYSPSGDALGASSYKINRYSSIPVYLTLKQNYAFNANSNIYFKGDLGYSFNRIRDTYYTNFTDIAQPGVLTKNDGDSYLSHLKAKNGLYVGLSLGVEYKSFLVEIGYYHTDSKISYLDAIPSKATLGNQKYAYTQSSYKNDALRLSVGFKF